MKNKTEVLEGKAYTLYKGSMHYSRGNNLLHRVKWESHHKKEIPKGYVIHHVNFDPLDNDIDNLKLMTKREHDGLHTKKRWRDNPESFNNNWRNGVEEAKKWRNSTEGEKYKEKHKELLKTYWDSKEFRKMICESCSKEYETNGTHSKYCSKACNQREYMKRKKAN